MGTTVWSERVAKRFGTERGFWNHTLLYDDAEVGAFMALPRPTRLANTQLALAGFPRVFPKALAVRKAAVKGEPIFEWLSERALVVSADKQQYDAKIVHIHLTKASKSVYVLLSFKDGDAWVNELRRFDSPRAKPLFAGTGLAWPGAGEPKPGTPSSDLYALLADGVEALEEDLWARPPHLLAIAVGPPPHLYFVVEAVESDRVWAVDPTILVKDKRRIPLWKGYSGDSEGRYSAIWLHRNRVTPVLRTSIGFEVSDRWKRRNAAVLLLHWSKFKALRTRFTSELLFNYDADDRLKLSLQLLMIPPNPASWTTSRVGFEEFKSRLILADQRAYYRFDLPHMRGGIPDDEDAAETEETERAVLSGIPPALTLPFSKLKVSPTGMPAPAITHNGKQVTNMAEVSFEVPSDAYYEVANSGLLNSAQLLSLYSTTGTRCHLVLCFKPLINPLSLEVNDRDVVFVQMSHVQENEKHCPYETRAGRHYMKPQFHAFVFEAFYVQFVQHVALKGRPWAHEYCVYHPHLLLRGKIPQTYLDAIYRMDDGSLAIVDWKTLQQARAPGYIIEGNVKNRVQIVTNAAFFMLQTKIRLDTAILVYITRLGDLTTLTFKLDECLEVIRSALMNPGVRRAQTQASPVMSNHCKGMNPGVGERIWYARPLSAGGLHARRCARQGRRLRTPHAAVESGGAGRVAPGAPGAPGDAGRPGGGCVRPLRHLDDGRTRWRRGAVGALHGHVRQRAGVRVPQGRRVGRPSPGHPAQRPEPRRGACHRPQVRGGVPARGRGHAVRLPRALWHGAGGAARPHCHAAGPDDGGGVLRREQRVPDVQQRRLAGGAGSARGPESAGALLQPLLCGWRRLQAAHLLLRGEARPGGAANDGAREGRRLGPRPGHLHSRVRRHDRPGA